MSKKSEAGRSTICLNKKAGHDYFIEQRFEAGIELMGWEVKSLRDGHAQISESHVIFRNGQAWLLNAIFPPLMSASTHVETDQARTRRLLLHRREIEKLAGSVERQGYTVVPIAMYWKNGRAKIEIGLAKGKKLHDKRATIKERDWDREKARLFKHK